MTDAGLVVTTLSREPLPAGIEQAPPLASLAPEPVNADVPIVTVPSQLPVVTLKLLFQAGSARDPSGKEGLAAIAAAMLADAGSRRMRIDEIREALHPLAASFSAQVDKELVTLTGTFPRDAWERVRGGRAAAARRARVSRGGLPAREGPGAERARPGPAGVERRGARQGAAAGEPVRRHAVRPPRGRHGGGDPGDRARRREGVRPGALRPRRRRGRPRRRHAARARRAAPSRARRAARRCAAHPDRGGRDSGRRGSRSRSSRRRRAARPSRSATRSTSSAATPTSSRCGSRAPGSASTAPRPRTCTSASARRAA